MEFLEEMEYVGDIPKGWKWVKLGEIADVRDGTHDSPKETIDGKYLITSKHIKNGKIDFSKAYKISLDDFEAINKRSKVDKYDILFSMIGTIGEMVIVDFEPDFAIKNVGLFKTRNKDLSKWIYYYLKSNEAQAEIRASLKGSTQQYITLGDLRNFPILLPPLPEQKAIAEVLSSIDDKIELLHRQNKTLEEMAMNLFRQWFIEPTKDGLPDGWEEKALDEIAEFLNGIPSQKYPGDKLPVIKIKEMREGITENSDYCNNNIPKKYLVNSGDILFSWSGSLEVVIWFGGIGVLNQHIFKVTSLEYPKWFCYLSIKQHIAEFRAIAESKTTTMGHIQREHLSNTKVFIPPKIFFENYNKAITPIFDKIIANTSQIQTLEKLRDTLLPKLINGEIRVKI